MNDRHHLEQIALLTQILEREVRTLEPDTENGAWSEWLETVGTVAAIWHHLEQINTARDDRTNDEPF